MIKLWLTVNCWLSFCHVVDQWRLVFRCLPLTFWFCLLSNIPGVEALMVFQRVTTFIAENILKLNINLKWIICNTLLATLTVFLGSLSSCIICTWRTVYKGLWLCNQPWMWKPSISVPKSEIVSFQWNIHFTSWVFFVLCNTVHVHMCTICEVISPLSVCLEWLFSFLNHRDVSWCCVMAVTDCEDGNKQKHWESFLVSI